MRRICEAVEGDGGVVPLSKNAYKIEIAGTLLKRAFFAGSKKEKKE